MCHLRSHNCTADKSTNLHYIFNPSSTSCARKLHYKNTRNYKNFGNWLVYSFQSFTYINKFSTNEWIETLRVPVWLVILLDCEYDIKWSCNDGDLYLAGSLPLCLLSPLCCAIVAVLTILFAAATLVLGSNYSGVPAIINYKSPGPSYTQHSHSSLLWIYVLFWTVKVKSLVQ